MTQQPEETSYKDWVATTAMSFAGTIARSGNGDKAELRRMDLEDGCPLYWRLAARNGIAMERAQPWMRFARVIARMTPAAAPENHEVHDPKRRLGTVLADGGDPNWSPAKDDGKLSEKRLGRLLKSRGDSRMNMLERSMRMMPTGAKVNVVDLAWAFQSDRSSPFIADAYYRRLDGAMYAAAS